MVDGLMLASFLTSTGIIKANDFASLDPTSYGRIIYNFGMMDIIIVNSFKKERKGCGVY
jgi:hypothetical protein